MSSVSNWILALDTATDQAGIGLFDGTTLATSSWPAGRQQTTELLPHIAHLASQCQVSLEQIAAVAVAIGPGSFTGLRVGLSVAKGLVLANESALIAIPTLDIVAHPFQEVGVACLAVAPAGRGRVIWNRYAPGDTSAPQNSTFDEYLAAASSSPADVVVGELSRDQREALESAGCQVASIAAGIRQPAVLAELGWQRWQAGAVDDPVLLEPAYLHGRPNPR